MNKQPRKNILFSGGHLTPAVAVIEEITKTKKTWKILFVGRTNEEHVITGLEGAFTLFSAGRNVVLGIVQAFLICFRDRPDIVVSFGGYIGFSLCLAAWLLDIPILIHEQTHRMGLANRIISHMAHRVLVAYPKTKHIPLDVTPVVVGMPIRSSFLFCPPKLSFSIPKGTILYITGGTIGAVSLNDLVFPIVEKLLRDAIVIHQTGTLSYQQALDTKQTLPKALQKHYYPVQYLDAQDVSWIMHHMQLLIGRSGANTVFEVAYLAKQAIFVPLPWSRNGEQKENARFYEEKTGSAIVFDQIKGTSDLLYRQIQSMLKKSVTSTYTKEALPLAQTVIVRHIADCLS